MLGHSTEDLAALQCAIRWSDGDPLESLFRRTTPSAAASAAALSLNLNDDLIVVQKGEILN